jgi:hypothetical protein
MQLTADDARIVAFITEAAPARRILTHIGESAEPPPIAPALRPPAWGDRAADAVARLGCPRTARVRVPLRPAGAVVALRPPGEPDGAQAPARAHGSTRRSSERRFPLHRTASRLYTCLRLYAGSVVWPIRMNPAVIRDSSRRPPRMTSARQPSLARESLELPLVDLPAPGKAAIELRWSWRRRRTLSHAPSGRA